MTQRNDPLRKHYASIYLDGGGDPSLAQIDAFLGVHFNARAVSEPAAKSIEDGVWDAIEKRLDEDMPCHCIDAYKDRGLIDPQCERHDFVDILRELRVEHANNRSST